MFPKPHSRILSGVGRVHDRVVPLSGGSDWTTLFDATNLSLVQCTRAGSGAYWTSTGLLAYAGNDTLRVSYDRASGVYLGILVEPSATNLMLWSSNMSNAGSGGVWYAAGPVTCTLDGAKTNPTGSLGMYKIAVTGGGGSGYKGWRQNFSRTASTTYTIIFIADASGEYTRYYCGDLSNGIAGARWDCTGLGTATAINGGVTGVTAGIKYLGGTLYQCWYKFTTAASGTYGAGTLGFCIGVCPTATATSEYGATFTAEATTKGGYVYCPMVFANNNMVFMPILTSGSAVTRPSDKVKVPLPSGLVDKFDGAFIARCYDVSGTVFALPDTNTTLASVWMAGGGTIDCSLAVFGTELYEELAVPGFNKIGFRYSPNAPDRTVVLSANGNVGTPDTAEGADFSTAAFVTIGSVSPDGTTFSSEGIGHIQSLKYFNGALTNAELGAATL